MYEDLKDELLDNISVEIRKDADKALELYQALAGQMWLKDGEEYFLTFKEAAELVALIRTESGCPEEDFQDYYLAGGEGEVSDWVYSRAEALGYTLEDQPF